MKRHKWLWIYFADTEYCMLILPASQTQEVEEQHFLKANSITTITEPTAKLTKSEGTKDRAIFMIGIATELADTITEDTKFQMWLTELKQLWTKDNDFQSSRIRSSWRSWTYPHHWHISDYLKNQWNHGDTHWAQTDLLKAVLYWEERQEM